MVLGHPPPIIARGREDAPQGCCEGLTPVLRVGEALGARHAQGQATLAEPLAGVQDIPPAGPQTFPRLTGPTRAVGGTPRLRARALVDRPMGLVGRRALGDGVGIGAARRPALHLGGHDGGERRGTHGLEPGARAWRRGRVLGGRGAAVPPAQPGWTARRGGGAPAPRTPALSRCPCVAFACPGQPCAARTLVARIRFHGMLQWAGRRQRGRLGETTLEPRDPPRRRARLDISSGSHGRGVQLPRPQAQHQPPGKGPHLALLTERTRPVRAQGTRLAQAHRAGHTQLTRCSLLSHRARGATASLPQRGHVTPAGQRYWRKESAACRSSCRDGIKGFLGLLHEDVGDLILPILPG
jgi:hypothetical protein